MLGIDGEDLRYQRQVTWECCHNNIEVLFDSDTYFKQHMSFVETEQSQINLKVAKVFAEFDKDKDGKLAETETRFFMEATLKEEFDANEFNTARSALDKDQDGFIKPDDLVNFLSA